jgi:hypothetical protein
VTVTGTGTGIGIGRFLLPLIGLQSRALSLSLSLRFFCVSLLVLWYWDGVGRLDTRGVVGVLSVCFVGLLGSQNGVVSSVLAWMV